MPGSSTASPPAEPCLLLYQGIRAVSCSVLSLRLRLIQFAFSNFPAIPSNFTSSGLTTSLLTAPPGRSDIPANIGPSKVTGGCIWTGEPQRAQAPIIGLSPILPQTPH